MAFFGSRLLIVAAVALTTIAQVVAAPAACCELKSAVFGGDVCCHRPAATVESRSCCQHTPQVATSDAEPKNVPAPEECLWCTAGPKISSPDRVVPPSADDVDFAVAEPRLLSDVSFVGHDQPLESPVLRTAQANCAWLCVWRK